MIVQMKKVSIVVLEKERKQALKKLKDVGVVHLETLEGSGEKLSSYKEACANAYNAVSILSEVKVSKKEAKTLRKNGASSMDKDAVVQKCKDIIALSEQKKQIFESIANNKAELDRLSVWGTVNPSDFEYLRQKDICLKMYEIPEDKYSAIDGNLQTICVNTSKKQVRFLLISKEGQEKEKLPPEAFEVPLPLLSTDEIKKEIEDGSRKIEEIDASLKDALVYSQRISAFIKDIEKDIQFENVYSGMGREDTSSGYDLAWISGFVPEDCVETLKSCASENSWAMTCSEPNEDDEVPTKLKNNKFVSLIYPLTDFLGTVPGYHEYDISGWFLLFFTIFFGMIFGDGGYGALVTAVALICILKSIFAKKKVSPMLGLVLLLGFATMAWGAVTCTWFGLTPEQLPSWIKAMSVPPVSNAYDSIQWIPFWADDISQGTLTTANNLQIFCFSLALIQLCVAHVKGMVRYRKSLKCIGEFGCFVELIGMYWVVLSMVVSSTVFPLIGGNVYGLPAGTIAVCMVGGGFLLSFVFSNYDGSILNSIMESVKNIISVLLGVVNVFSDIVSYIRLWAVGLAGAAISNTVNTMAGPLAGRAVMFIFMIVLLVFGHGLNMILNLLSVIVHGVRLNTLEFSNHLGMSWSGFKYAPFSNDKLAEEK